MYCPSCDKSYGAVHSRCPECHSWLKVSAPASSRTKSAKSASAVSMGSVSTLDKAPAAGSDWGANGADSWSDALPAPASSPSAFGADPAPVSDAWSGGNGAGWGGASSDSWGGGESAKLPSASPSSPAPSSVGWLGGGSGDDDGWGASSSNSGAFKAPATAPAPPSPATAPTNGFATPPLESADDGWGGSGSSLTGPPASLGKGPSIGFAPAGEDDGWGGASSSATFGGAPTSKASPPPASQGWLGGDESGVVEEEPAGWLGGAGPTAKINTPSENDGWLSGASASGPSMTEMVDRAINVEEADDFVDDSWVDEEVGNGEFDDLEAPEEYTPPAPEVGGAFIKMLLVAVLVLVVGGGLMFLNQEEKSPEQIKAEETAKELEFGRSSVKTGQNYLKEGKALLAIGPLEAAMTSLKTAGGTPEEILEAKVVLARALMKAKEFQKSYDHWVAIAKGDSEYKKEAKSQMVECSKLLRAQATDQLAEAAGYIRGGESASVLDLGEKALKIYESHGGTASQKGKAWGVIGRGYLNGKEYGKAKDALRKAKALNPGGGYEADLSKIAAETAPSSYYYDYGGAPAAPARPTTVRVKASISGDGPAVPVRRVGGGGRRPSVSRPAGAPASNAAPPPASPRTREIPAYQRNKPGSSSGGGRLGEKNVLNTY